MDFERSNILIPILDSLAANDQTLFWSLQQKILGDFGSRGMSHSSAAAAAICQAFQDELGKRGEAILSEMKRVLDGVYIEEVANLAASLRAELVARLQKVGDIAYPEFARSTDFLRRSLPNESLPWPSAIFEHIEKLKPRLFAEIELFCAKLHDSRHDRFIIVDGVKALHLGGSIKDLGTSDSLIDVGQVDPLKQRFEELWLRAKPVV